MKGITKPITAAINGACYGGGMELALACELRIASTNAVFANSEVRRAEDQQLGTLLAGAGEAEHSRAGGNASIREHQGGKAKATSHLSLSMASYREKERHDIE